MLSISDWLEACKDETAKLLPSRTLTDEEFTAASWLPLYNLELTPAQAAAITVQFNAERQNWISNDVTKLLKGITGGGAVETPIVFEFNGSKDILMAPGFDRSDPNRYVMALMDNSSNQVNTGNRAEHIIDHSMPEGWSPQVILSFESLDKLCTFMEISGSGFAVEEVRKSMMKRKRDFG